MDKGKPDWLKIRISNSSQNNVVDEMLTKLNLYTVCQEANCPNLMDCFGKKTATFMILGRICSRNCSFCNVTKGIPMMVEDQEPINVARAVQELALKHVVITSVTRDDLVDGGAFQFVRVIEEIKKVSGSITIEVLIPDFQGNKKALSDVARARPDVINHNVETIKRLYPAVRPMADYDRSLELIKSVKDFEPNIYTKSGFMIGLGENSQEVEELLKDLRKMDCDIVTIGQYLTPSKKHHPVIEFIQPEVFTMYKQMAERMGFRYVASSPLVRSSYNARDALL